MYDHQTADFSTSFPRSNLRVRQSAAAALDRLIERFQERWDAARHQRVMSKLPPHLLHDVGEIDCRPPPPRSPSERHADRQTSLEELWLRGLR